MKPSLRRRLMLLLLTTVFLGWTVTALLTWRDAVHEIGEMLDAHLSRSAHIIASQFLRSSGAPVGETLPSKTHNDYEIAFQIWDRSGALRLRSESAPKTRMSSAEKGYSDTVIDGERWRIFSLAGEDGRYIVQVGEHSEIREEFGEIAAGHIMHSMYFFLPALALLVWLAIGWGLKPLARVAGEIAGRTPDNLAALDDRSTPREASPLINAINSLFARLSRLIEQERRFTADATHELRTPLSAVKVQAQVALASSRDEERRRALTNVVGGIDRMAHLVEQLLMLARLDPKTSLPSRQAVSLQALAAQCISEHVSSALAKNIEIGLAATGVATVDGDPTLLAVLLRNLVDNAIRYTPSGGEVRIGLEQDAAGVRLCVSDNGPGVPAPERAKVLGRFYRILGSGEAGSGLGLSIVQRIAELHGASLELGDGPDQRGLSVTLSFPPHTA